MLESMSAYQKVAQRDMLDYHQSHTFHDPNAYANYSHGSYAGPVVYQNQPNTGKHSAGSYFLTAEQLNASGSPPYEESVASTPHSRQPSATAVNQVKLESVKPNQLKRRASESPSFDVAPVAKRQASQLQIQQVNSNGQDHSGHTSPYSPFVVTPANSVSFPTGHNLAPAAYRGHQYSTSTASQVSLAAPSPNASVYSPSFTTVKTEPSPRAPMTPVPRPASSSPLKSSIPRLVRTSTMQHSGPMAPAAFQQTHSPGFNPYAMYPSKANLKLKGDIDSMTKGWSDEEIGAHRRLVEFKRTQAGSQIVADFKPVTPQERQPSSITISCILWAEKKEYYVTSVDTIYLLEALVGVRFTVEEKNRIRRNLEGFRPATVSKSKQDSEEFFKVIMGFPHPKPRNIEKDVKVFPWKILSHALKKIISKYSASYSSTASAIMTPVPSSYGQSEFSGSYGYPPSPHAEYANMEHYGFPDVAAYVAQQPMSGRASAPVTTAPIPDLQLQVPATSGAFDPIDLYGYAQMPGMPHANMLLTPEAMSAPLVQPASEWDYTNYMNGGQMVAGPHSAPPTVYHRMPLDSATFMPPSHYQIR